MKALKRHYSGTVETARPDGGFHLHPKAFVFFDRATGTQRFEVNATPEHTLPIEEAASLLAMQCVMRGRNPRDFRVMVMTCNEMIDDLVPRAQALIQACLATARSPQLSPRQQEVLREVGENFTNKEIAARINLSVSTVKFHVSALLEKFDVENRAALMVKSGDTLVAEKLLPGGGITKVSPVVVGGGSQVHDDSRPKLLRLASLERRGRDLA